MVIVGSTRRDPRVPAFFFVRDSPSSSVVATLARFGHTTSVIHDVEHAACGAGAFNRRSPMSTLIDDLASQLQGDTLSQMSRQLGADEGSTAQAISMALPMLLGGLATEVETPTGAQSLNRALDEDHDGSLLDNVGALFGSASGTADVAVPRALNGAGILEHVLGGKREPVQQGIGRATGLDSQQVGRLLMTLAPLVMAYLGRRKRQGGATAGDISSVLQTERREVEKRSPDLGGLLGQVFGGGGAQNRPGIADDIARMAPQVLGGLFGGRR